MTATLTRLILLGILQSGQTLDDPDRRAIFDKGVCQRADGITHAVSVMNGDVAYFVLAEKEKCTGCRACEVACFAAHQKGTLKTVGAVTAPVIPNLYLTWSDKTCMPVQCHHCEGAPCLQSCLTGAIERVNGTVVLNPKKCIGCKNCVMACPFGAAAIIGAAALPSGTTAHARKCDLCIGRDEPACVATCPNKALHLVDVVAEVQTKRVQAADAMEATLSSNVAQGGR